ncbi:CPBP family intramembrane glutamic endopeptidase [Colwellia sp. RSH04]|uniref:CPBP family intramembrane glutamic endopeptidase n=1 Tax=Colwellia sp. RSH04 TaxID=2305464 RepID=UPI000E56FEBD|nr:CPBP family intramembrane glutamic endopeptidase [Colwellia sp. RSH04]RHW76268.1 CPBP family intramembrane metalloprotease [Colwellia sp. RSH04]
MINALLVSNRKLFFTLSFLGFVGVWSILAFIPMLLEVTLIQDIPLTVSQLQLVSALQTGLMVVLMSWLGCKFANRVNLHAPIIEAVLNKKNFQHKLIKAIQPTLVGGVLGGLLMVAFSFISMPYLPVEFVKIGEQLNPSWYTRLLYGGITEEILIRWGMMSLLVWLMYKFIQKNNEEVSSKYFIIAIVITSMLFGIGHLPVINLLGAEMTVGLVSYIIIANSLFGFIAGWLFWKYGLESAIAAHMIAHIVMMSVSLLG